MGSEEIKQCYAIPDDNDALSCIKKRVAESQDPCRPRIVLLVQENCGGCMEEKARYKKDIDSGIVTPVDINTQEGLEIAQHNEIEAVPALLILDCQNNAIE